MNKIASFVSGEEYSLSELFGGDTKVVIPDLQRDYCWGDNAWVSINDKKPRELVSGFVKSLMEQYEEAPAVKVTLGLIYGYEQPHNSLQICDGQQRLTTLFLLLGLLNVRTGGTLSSYIISEKEMNDDYEPHLLYAIRESTLYFLSDLSHHVFVERTTPTAGIRHSNWYFNEYDQDASIQSILAAVDTIDGMLDRATGLDCDGFAHFLLHNLCVLYYDMENRSRGEETYVVINTTGEPLSPTENIKPILLGAPGLSVDAVKKYSDQWEDREEWFWQHRGGDKTADKGMQEFFMWYWQIGLIQESSWVGDKKQPLNTRDLFLNAPKRVTENANEPRFSMDNYNKFQSLDNLDKYFKALTALVDGIHRDEKLQKVLLTMKKRNTTPDFSTPQGVWSWLRTADLDIVLPLLCLMAEHEGTTLLYPFARRLRKNHFDALWGKADSNAVSRRGANYVDWRYLVQIISQTTDADLLTVKTSDLQIAKIQLIDLPEWYTEDEQRKTLLGGLSASVEEMEDSEVLMGDLTPIWHPANDVGTCRDPQKRWTIIDRACKALRPSTAADDMDFANWFRLYRLVSDLIGFDHISNCAWTFEGCYYSLRPSIPWWIESWQMERLMAADSPIDFMKQYVKRRVSAFIRQPSDHKELVKSWLTLKTLQADAGCYLLNYWNDRAVSAFFDITQNYIVPHADFHWGNVFCGYSYSYTVFPARDNHNWQQKSNLDSPLTSLPFIPSFFERASNVIDGETIQQGDQEIEPLIQLILQ